MYIYILPRRNVYVFFTNTAKHGSTQELGWNQTLPFKLTWTRNLPLLCISILVYQESAPNIVYYIFAFYPPLFLSCMYVFPRKITNSNLILSLVEQLKSRTSSAGFPAVSTLWLPNSCRRWHWCSGARPVRWFCVYQKWPFEPKNSISFCQRFKVADLSPIHFRKPCHRWYQRDLDIGENRGVFVSQFQITKTSITTWLNSWPFDPIVGGHLTLPLKGSLKLTIPKRARLRRIARHFFLGLKILMFFFVEPNPESPTLKTFIYKFHHHYLRVLAKPCDTGGAIWYFPTKNEELKNPRLLKIMFSVKVFQSEMFSLCQVSL